jgi:hypothetical protein
MIHQFKIETQINNNWQKTNWGGNNQEIVVNRAKEIVACWTANKNNHKHVGYGRTGVRVINESEEVVWLYEENNPCKPTCY